MKGLDHDITPIEKHETKEFREKSRYIASMRPKPGQSIYKYFNRKITTIGENDYEKATVTLQGKSNKRLVLEKGALYVVALNKKNAAKKFLKLLKT